MANAITLAKTFIPILDKIYKNASLTAVLDGNPELVRQGANYNEMIIPKISMQYLRCFPQRILKMAEASRTGEQV